MKSELSFDNPYSVATAFITLVIVALFLVRIFIFRQYIDIEASIR